MNRITFFRHKRALIYVRPPGRPKAPGCRRAFRRHFQGQALVISTQVIQEFYVAATRKLALSSSRAKQLIEDMCNLRVVEIRGVTILRSADLAPEFKLSCWDGLLLAAAEEAEAEVLLTEDLNHNQVYAGIRAVNPFRTH